MIKTPQHEKTVSSVDSPTAEAIVSVIFQAKMLNIHWRVRICCFVLLFVWPDNELDSGLHLGKKQNKTRHEQYEFVTLGCGKS